VYTNSLSLVQLEVESSLAISAATEARFAELASEVSRVREAAQHAHDDALAALHAQLDSVASARLNEVVAELEGATSAAADAARADMDAQFAAQLQVVHETATTERAELIARIREQASAIFWQ
jgi:hypothetical protein